MLISLRAETIKPVFAGDQITELLHVEKETTQGEITLKIVKKGPSTAVPLIHADMHIERWTHSGETVGNRYT